MSTTSYMDADTVADELYGLRPDEFTETRNERAKQARSRGQRDVATSIARLRKPAASAWVVNLLVREAAGEVDQLLQLGEQLRQAQTELDAEELRALSQKRSQVVSALATRGRELARDAGHGVSEPVGREVEGTLEAALADPEAAAQVRSGRLTTALSYSGLGPLGSGGADGSSGGQVSAGAVAGTAAGTKRPAGQRKGDGRGAEAGGGKGRQRGTGRQEAGRQEQVKRAERSLAEAEEAARSSTAEQDRARSDEDDLRSRKGTADERVSALHRDLERAREEATAVTERLTDATERRERADRDAAAAQQRVEEAREALDRERRS